MKSISDRRFHLALRSRIARGRGSRWSATLLVLALGACGLREVMADQPQRPVHPAVNPFAGAYDDFDDDDDDDFALPPGYFTRGGGALGLGKDPLLPPGRPGGADLGGRGPPNYPSPHSYSAGGAPNSGNAPDPIRTQQGITVGGGAPNGLLASGEKFDPIPVDTETGDVSPKQAKEIVNDFNFPDADILDIAKTLGKLTGKNFIHDKDVKGRVSIISNSPITVGEAWKVFLTSLDINGFGLVRSGTHLRIARQRDARDKQLKTYTGNFSPESDALISRVFRLKYISAEEVVRTFRGFMPANSRILAYDQTNTVIVTDTGYNIAKMAKLLSILDVEGYEAGIEVIPVKFASATELSKLIDALIPGTAGTGPGGSASAASSRFGGGGTTASRFSARRTKEGGIINTIIADDRTNTLIVHANSVGANQVRELVNKLDQKVPSTRSGKVRVYYLQFAEAEQVAATLNNVSQGSGRSGTGSSGSSSSPLGGGGGSGTGINPVAQTLFEGSVKIAADKATNSLVITASPSDYSTIHRVLVKLDIPRQQVFVETAIMEVSVGASLAYSANVANTTGTLGSITSPGDIAAILSGNFASLQGAILGAPFGNPSTVTINGSQQSLNFSTFGLVKALQGNSSTNILATPQIIALDNTEATFENTQKIPVQTQTLTATGASQITPTFQPVTLSIKIKPQINKLLDFVKLDVTTKLSNVDSSAVPSTLRNISFASVERTAQTTVVVADSDTIVLGGLMRDDVTNSENKVPILGDIPIIGWLFKSKDNKKQKTNLLIFMTPHIIRPYEKVRAILDRKLKERDEYLESNGGSSDPYRQQRDNIIRSLPDMDVIKKNQPQWHYTQEDNPAHSGAPEPEPIDPPNEPNSALPGPPPLVGQSATVPENPGSPFENNG